MIHIKDHKTPDMFDRFPYLGPKRKHLIETSWAKVFREHILPTLPVNRVFSKYDPVMGAPTRELYAILGLMVIQQMHDLTDDEAVSQFAFNMQWHYALNITSTADADAPSDSLQNPSDPDAGYDGHKGKGYQAHLKAAGINIIRAAAFRNRENEGEPALIAALSMLSCTVKERVQHVSADIRHWISLRPLKMHFAALYAA